ncbi:hypothetical protein [Nonlabens antarcticus]|uniref:hypothetical protein n=1 Tax=Nonlabens antarcticus TaxID=392714 RepID=UPI001890C12F|nr:hypothetical protein [Nonlabens antarcticus]
MSHIKRCFEFYISSSLHVSFCYVAFYTIVAFYGGFTPGYVEFIAVGTATLAGYNVAKYIHLIGNRFRFHYPIKIITVICGVVALVTVIDLGMYAVLLFGFCAVLTSLYSLPEILGRSFRQIPIIKLVTIGISWSVMAVVLPRILMDVSAYGPVFYEKWSIGLMFWEALEYSLFVIALCIPFEIRDLKYDSPQLRTLPQLIGTTYSKWVGFVLLILCGLIEFVQYNDSPLQAIATLIALTITGFAVSRAGAFKSDYYASFFVESIPILWLGIYMLLNF